MWYCMSRPSGYLVMPVVEWVSAPRAAAQGESRRPRMVRGKFILNRTHAARELTICLIVKRRVCSSYALVLHLETQRNHTCDTGCVCLSVRRRE